MTSSSTVVRLDRFTVPEPAGPLLLEKVREIHAKLRALPGFQNDSILESQGPSGPRQIVTLVEWKDSESAFAAREAMQRYHAEQAFNAAEFCAEHGITPEFGVYREITSSVEHA